MPKVNPGELAPDFALPAGSGQTIRLSDRRGQNVVLYFYPKDDTPGCTKEACSFRDEYPALQAANTVVLGVSADPVKAHEKFAQKYNLPFPLLADEGAKVAEEYGVWVEKNNYGKKYMGIQRSTFLIGPDGAVRKVWAKVKPDGHGQEVLAAIGQD